MNLALLPKSKRAEIEADKTLKFHQYIYKNWPRYKIESWLKKQKNEQAIRRQLNEIRLNQ